MNQTIQPPSTIVVPQARPVGSDIVCQGQAAMPAEASGANAFPVDRWALASAICGITAIVPVISQLAGIILGVVALRRIRRAHRQGLAPRGSGWAIMGISLSLFMLLSWILIFAVFGFVMSIFSDAAHALDKAMPARPS